ncbi:MAG: hypothetical protein ABIQ86_16830 [Steroidobacteraceae bacterium]
MSNSDPHDDLVTTGERPGPGSSELYAEWAARMQRGRGRHAAISRNLNTWANYKNWSDKISKSWESDQQQPPKKK